MSSKYNNLKLKVTLKAGMDKKGGRIYESSVPE